MKSERPYFPFAKGKARGFCARRFTAGRLDTEYWKGGMRVLPVVQNSYFGSICETIFPSNTRKTHLEMKFDGIRVFHFNHGDTLNV